MSTLDLKNQEISRQLELVPPHILSNPVTIIGAGAIGSWVALGLAKSGFKNIAIFDDDDVDVVNMSSQFFGISDIGQKKVKALSERIEEMTGTIITPIPEKWNGMKLRGTVVMAADSMAVRKQIFETHRDNIETNWLIDARMGAEVALLYAFNPNNKEDSEDYSKSLYDDKDAVQERCTAKSTTYCAIVLSGLIIKAIRDCLMPGKLMRHLSLHLRENDWACFSNDLRPKKG